MRFEAWLKDNFGYSIEEFNNLNIEARMMIRRAFKASC